MTESAPAAKPISLNDAAFIDQLTPAMKQFVDIKNRYPNTLVLYRMGDFYETFFDDAVKANRLIGITLTKRGKLLDGTPIPMAGIPMVSLDQYIARLVRMGESIVIVEQVGTPGKSGAAMERRVSRIITPGTLTETALLPEKNDAVLLSLQKPMAKKGGVWGFVWLTMSSGDFRCEEVEEEQFESALARISPSEVLADDALRSALRESHPDLTVTPLPDWRFDAERGAEQLCRTFGLSNLDAWGVSKKAEILAAANALLDYTTETQVDMVPFILPLKLVSESEFIVIDPASRRNLEIASTARGDDGPTLFSVLDGCKTSMGSRELRRWLSQPLRDRKAASARHEAIASCLEDGELLSSILASLEAMPDIERITSRIALGSVRPRELAALRDALPEVQPLAQCLASRPEALFSQIGAALGLPNDIEETLRRSLLEEPATFLRDGDVMSSNASEELKSLRELRDNTGQCLLEMEQRERAETGISSLRVQYNKVSGFYIEVSRSLADQVPPRYHRRQTLKNAERFITPELKAFEDRALSAKERAAALERELYEALVKSLTPFVPQLMAAAHALASLDVLAALAAHARERGWVRPALADRPGIAIKGGRHPVVETTLEVYVPNDCRLEDGRRMLIITGPNMGGKSTYMRSVALIVLLAWAGSFVPAEAASIGPVDRIHTRIGASDDLARGRSTFMVEMTEAAGILSQATDRSLVLMDEIGRGTSTYDGLSLAASIAQELVQQVRCLTLFATHYFELTSLASELREVANVHVSAAQGKRSVVFLHQIAEGPASRSYGIAVAQLAGIPAPVVRRAKALMTKLEERDAARSAIQPELFDSSGIFRSVQEAPADAASADASQKAELPQRCLDACAFQKRIAEIDAESLSARDALSLIFELQAQAAKNEAAAQEEMVSESEG